MPWTLDVYAFSTVAVLHQVYSLWVNFVCNVLSCTQALLLAVCTLLKRTAQLQCFLEQSASSKEARLGA